MFEEAEADDVINSRSAGSADRIPFNQKHLIEDAIPSESRCMESCCSYTELTPVKSRAR